jgi:hypothetical protein
MKKAQQSRLQERRRLTTHSTRRLDRMAFMVLPLYKWTPLDEDQDHPVNGPPATAAMWGSMT